MSTPLQRGAKRSSSKCLTVAPQPVQGIRHGSAAARELIPRILHLLSFDNDSGVVGKVLERAAAEVPLWVWLPWIPQLLSSLQRSEAPSVQNILLSLALAFPQVRKHALGSFWVLL